MPGRLLKRALSVLGAAGLVVAMSSTTAMASSAPASHHAGTEISIGHHLRPLSAAGCAGDACITLGDIYNSNGEQYVNVYGCAWKTAVYGYIHLFGPSGNHKDSITKTWHVTHSYCLGTDDAFEHAFADPPSGKWCSETISGGVNDGIACETLS
jgi:hypothetical protein